MELDASEARSFGSGCPVAALHVQSRRLAKEVFIHVGLHKTGTSFLQGRVFPTLPGVRFVHPGPEFHPSTDADHALCNSDFSDLRLAIEQLLVEAE